MNAIIEQTQDHIYKHSFAQMERLMHKPTHELQDLLHECEDLRLAEDFSARTAAEINHAACMIILEKRGVK